MDTRPSLRPVDPLGEALHFLRMSGTFYCRSEMTAPWGMDMPAMDDFVMLHFVASGSAWLEVPGAAGRHLARGDLALVAHGRGHAIASSAEAPRTPLFELPREIANERYEIIRHGGGGETTTLVCGAVQFEEPAAINLLRFLPCVICIEGSTSQHDEWLTSTLRLMADEARHLRPGGETVVTRLADILVIQAIRAWLATDPVARTGWLAGLQDRQIGRAVAAIHRDPARNWSVESLADEVAMSRSAFSARFSQVVGMPTMQYLAQWRMQLANTWLRDHQEPLASVATRVGYQSEAAFSRAFKRHVGISPGSVHRGYCKVRSV
jgi:AraC-like DNA-binding protein